ncbi:Holliday junction DNA helicase subunit RuvA [Pustulibacterium marinum]|uniref:Holliday junction branch migration complex subunit RuvA n=1 Tax=Pustulibacterium marinum TaxID=1224947 RepID=A0A1I7HA04_9FLAO|nr:Holliday junction branch migration protein RuvA [Pustulibacterium marinum]SFU57581.1 Holliday junction DNA helicase subunit RuvA [Pustulibacterium marinum]
MITHIQGRLIEKNPTHVVIDCHGVGYFINISLNTFSRIGTDENLRLFTHLQVKEDAHTLYGFYTVAEREIFRLLISVSGIGPGTARTMLSSLTATEVKNAIAVGDVAVIQSVKGIGVKTAQRVILDLKDKVLKIHDVEDINTLPNNTNKDEALSALEVLGFVRKQAEKVVNKILAKEPNLSVEEIIKEALKNL